MRISYLSSDVCSSDLHTKRVSPTFLIAFERNRYSVPASFANRPVSLRVYPDRLVIAAEGQILCEHNRIIDRSHQKPGQTIYDWRHYLAVEIGRASCRERVCQYV